MSYIVEILATVASFPLGELIRRNPGARVELEQVVPTDDGLVPFFWVRGVDASVATDADEVDPALDEVDVLDDAGDALLCRTVWDRNAPGLQQVIVDSGVTLLEATGTDDGWRFQFRFTDQRDARRFQTDLRERDVAFEILRVYSVREMVERRHGITPEQHEAIVAVHDAGFFETPRRTSLEAVAERLGISAQALSMRYRRGLDTLLDDVLHAEEKVAET
ncbi:hypothetical protein DMJ13_04315 [halophilic archaeon]|nr:hypothetical protein DMJ13_04315 [halophilic archaeon]